MHIKQLLCLNKYDMYTKLQEKKTFFHAQNEYHQGISKHIHMKIYLNHKSKGLGHSKRHMSFSPSVY
jgi:hypothetical protein